MHAHGVQPIQTERWVVDVDECESSSVFNPEWLFFFPGFMPLSLPSFFQIAESLLGDCVSLLPGGLVGGGVMGLSLVPVLSESSVIPGPAPPDPSDPVPAPSRIAAGEEVVVVSLTLKRDLCGETVAESGGADWR